MIELHGTVPVDINLELHAYYMAQHRTGCLMTPTYLTGAVSGAFSPIYHSFPLNIKRDGDNYSATIIVDKFLPSRCGWDFFTVKAELSKRELRSLAGNVLVKKPLLGMPSGETWKINSQKTPITWRCRFNKLATLPPNYQSFACDLTEDERLAKKYKQTHVITAADRSIQVYFLDLD